MAKDAKGHGSNSHDYSGVKTYPAITGFEGLRKSLNLDALQAGGQPVSGNANAAHELSSGGPKSVASPVHDSMVGANVSQFDGPRERSGLGAHDQAVKDFKEGRMTHGDIPPRTPSERNVKALNESTGYRIRNGTLRGKPGK
jgi:hypothetical protein